MWKSRELTLVILFAVTAFVYHGSIGQLPLLITGIPGLGYYFVIGLNIIFGTAFLMFEGKRWRYFFFGALFCLLMGFIHVILNPFYVFANVPTLIASFVADVVFNSFYKEFQRRKQLKWLSIMQVTVGHSILDTFLRILLLPLLMPPEFTTTFTSVTLMMFPLILFYGVAGGYISFKIYSRINKPVRGERGGLEGTKVD